MRPHCVMTVPVSLDESVASSHGLMHGLALQLDSDCSVAVVALYGHMAVCCLLQDKTALQQRVTEAEGKLSESEEEVKRLKQDLEDAAASHKLQLQVCFCSKLSGKPANRVNA